MLNSDGGVAPEANPFRFLALGPFHVPNFRPRIVTFGMRRVGQDDSMTTQWQDMSGGADGWTGVTDRVC